MNLHIYLTCDEVFFINNSHMWSSVFNPLPLFCKCEGSLEGDTANIDSDFLDSKSKKGP